MQKITPFLWFDKEAEAAANLYVSIFQELPSPEGESKIIDIQRYGDTLAKAAGQSANTVQTVSFRLYGQDFVALNGGKPDNFNTDFTGAISFLVTCETQDEVDALWEKLTANGGEESQCGWLKDKFGMYWQIVPRILNEYLGDKDPQKAKRVTEAMLKMKKIDIAELEKAHGTS